jgi:hypothetical protein
MTSKRQKFLEVFLNSLGAKQIQWTAQNENSIFGTVIYDPADLDERQDFVWHMSEDKVPDDNVVKLLNHVTDMGLLEGDKLKVPVRDIEIPHMNQETKEKLFGELFSVSVNMIEEGNETDQYFIHD